MFVGRCSGLLTTLPIPRGEQQAVGLTSEHGGGEDTRVDKSRARKDVCTAQRVSTAQADGKQVQLTDIVARQAQVGDQRR